MTRLTRREFGRTVGAGGTAALVGRAVAAAPALVVGAATTSFRDFPRVTGRDNLADIVRALTAAKVSHVELAFSNIEPAPPSTGTFMGGSPAYPRRVVLSPEEVAATDTFARADLRAWRLATPISHFTSLGATLSAAGIRVHAVALHYNDSFTDAEIDATLSQAKALGLRTVSSPLTMGMARRLAPFAVRHGVAVSIHHAEAGHASGALAIDDLGGALALSPAFKATLDLGTLTSAGCDVVAEVRKYQSRLSHVIVRDRFSRGGAGQPLGEGDAPIAGVFGVLRASPSVIPAFFMYDYAGLRSPTEEVAAAVAILERASR